MKNLPNKSQHHNRLTRSESNSHRDYNPQPTVKARLPSGGWCAMTFASKMDHKKHHQAWEKFLDPAVIQDSLIASSLFIAAFDSLKSSIVDRVKQFYQVGLGVGGDTLDPEYSSQVASRNSSPLYASLDWLKEHDAISQQDIDAFNEVKGCRNRLAHSLLSMIAEDSMPDLRSSFETLFALLRKIEVWWIVNVEIPTNPDFDGTEEIDEDGIQPGPCMSMQIMMDVATGKSDYLNKYREHQANKAQHPTA